MELKTRLTVLLSLGVVLLAGCGGDHGDGDESVAGVVDASTTPEDVVRAYLTALQHEDGRAAASLTTEPYAGRDFWAADPPRIEDVEISAARPESTTGTAGEGHAAAVSVPVSFDLHGADPSMPDGPTTWGYILVRDSDHEAWRIADAGTG